ncbi:thiamine phosphate synthase [Paradesertivirga mongoliensis]|uniref:Thiamine phosphate synthase n=1 Tax=Paradesertivirga mongoliensis TaxID=2100740 RepID=A0ABW4ZRG7_9SPHI
MDRLIVITDPDCFAGEANLLNQLFKAGLKRLHLRKPGHGCDEIRQLAAQISPKFRKYISVHYHPDLVTELNLGGKHYSYHDILNADLGDPEYIVSCSLHTWEELKELQGRKIDYCFMSPVYDSVSKRGYMANRALSTVPDFAKGFPAYALGGINLSNSTETLERGFYGIAVLGYLWEDKENAVKRFEMLREEIDTYVC